MTAEAVWRAAVAIGLVPSGGFRVYEPVGKPVVPHAQAFLGSGRPGQPFGMPLLGGRLTRDHFEALGASACLVDLAGGAAVAREVEETGRAEDAYAKYSIEVEPEELEEDDGEEETAEEREAAELE